VGGERVDEVVVEGAAPFDASFAVLGLGAEAELAVDDRAAQGAFGVVVGLIPISG
jgi:hypothetical protein